MVDGNNIWIISLETFGIEYRNCGIVGKSNYTAVTFYPVTIIGILFCICIAQALEKVKRVGEAFAVLGKNSYHIMALHFFVFKLIDLFYGRITGADVETISHFPYAFENLWLVYYICGVGIPVLIIYILKKRF